MLSELVNEQSVMPLSGELARRMQIFKVGVETRLMVERLVYPLLVEDDDGYSIGELVEGLLGKLEQIIVNLNLSGQDESNFRKLGSETIMLGAISTSWCLHERFREEAIAEVLACATNYFQMHY